MKLKYNDNGKFRIIQLTDLHLAAYPFNENDQQALEGIEKLVRDYSPDLLVFTGDNIYSLEEHGADDPKETFAHFIEFLNSLEVPVSITFGNHDSEDKVTRAELQAMIDADLKYKAEEKEVFYSEDRRNSIVEVLSKDGEKPENILYLIDSGAYSGTDYSYYAWLLADQVQWFRKVAQAKKRGDGIKTDLAFLHIPLVEYWMASQNILSGAFNEDMAMNMDWIEGDGLGDYSMTNGVCSAEVNSGLFFEMLMNGEVWGAFAGHDHDNSFDGLHKDIHLVYGQKSGYNSYGSEKKGGRIIDLDADTKEIETYSVYYD